MFNCFPLIAKCWGYFKVDYSLVMGVITFKDTTTTIGTAWLVLDMLSVSTCTRVLGERREDVTCGCYLEMKGKTQNSKRSKTTSSPGKQTKKCHPLPTATSFER